MKNLKIAFQIFIVKRFLASAEINALLMVSLIIEIRFFLTTKKKRVLYVTVSCRRRFKTKIEN